MNSEIILFSNSVFRVPSQTLPFHSNKPALEHRRVVPVTFSFPQGISEIMWEGVFAASFRKSLAGKQGEWAERLPELKIRRSRKKKYYEKEKNKAAADAEPKRKVKKKKKNTHPGRKGNE